MKEILRTAIMLALFIPCAAYPGSHKMGNNQNCFYDSNPGRNKWHYYYCGSQSRGCAGKSGGGKNDQHYTIFDKDSFTFKTSPYDKYWCCGGTGEKSGTFVKDTGKGFYIDTQTKRKQLADGGSCNIRIQKTICGDVEEIDCTEPDTCSQGFTLRNKACIKPCGDDEVFESPASNTCISCKTTAYQGPSLDRQSCIKCDQYTEFFNRQTKKCIKKSTLKQYAKDTMKECWRCPNNVMLKCMEAVSLADKMGKTGPARLQEIRNIASFDGTDIVKACHLE